MTLFLQILAVFAAVPPVFGFLRLWKAAWSWFVELTWVHFLFALWMDAWSVFARQKWVWTISDGVHDTRIYKWLMKPGWFRLLLERSRSVNNTLSRQRSAEFPGDRSTSHILGGLDNR